MDVNEELKFFLNIQKKIVGVGVGGVRLGCGCERRYSGGRVWGIKLDVNEELKFCENSKNKSGVSGW